LIDDVKPTLDKSLLERDKVKLSTTESQNVICWDAATNIELARLIIPHLPMIPWRLVKERIL